MVEEAKWLIMSHALSRPSFPVSFCARPFSLTHTHPPTHSLSLALSLALALALSLYEKVLHLEYSECPV